MAITLDGTTGVTAAEFDGTVDASNLTGALPAIDGSALTGITPTTAGVLTAIAGSTLGAVGTYVFAHRSTSTSAQARFVSNSTYAGSTLYAGGLSASFGASDGYNDNTGISVGYASEPALSGTWRAMGNTSSTRLDNPITLFVRIA